MVFANLDGLVVAAKIPQTVQTVLKVCAGMDLWERKKYTSDPSVAPGGTVAPVASVAVESHWVYPGWLPLLALGKQVHVRDAGWMEQHREKHEVLQELKTIVLEPGCLQDCRARRSRRHELQQARLSRSGDDNWSD